MDNLHVYVRFTNIPIIFWLWSQEDTDNNQRPPMTGFPIRTSSSQLGLDKRGCDHNGSETPEILHTRGGAWWCSQGNPWMQWLNPCVHFNRLDLISNCVFEQFDVMVMNGGGFHPLYWTFRLSSVFQLFLNIIDCVHDFGSWCLEFVHQDLYFVIVHMCTRVAGADGFQESEIV